MPYTHTGIDALRIRAGYFRASTGTHETNEDKAYTHNRLPLSHHGTVKSFKLLRGGALGRVTGPTTHHRVTAITPDIKPFIQHSSPGEASGAQFIKRTSRQGMRTTTIGDDPRVTGQVVRRISNPIKRNRCGASDVRNNVITAGPGIQNHHLATGLNGVVHIVRRHKTPVD